MATNDERMRQIQQRFENLTQETAPTTSEVAPPITSARTTGRARSGLILLVLILAVVIVVQGAMTALTFSGNDFGDAKRTGQATVQSCVRRGPVGWTYGYWDQCQISIRWNDGSTSYSTPDKPHLFRASEVGTTVEIGDNGRNRSGPVFSRPTFPARPAVVVLGVVLLVIGAVPGLILVALLWGLARKAFRR